MPRCAAGGGAGSPRPGGAGGGGGGGGPAPPPPGNYRVTPLLPPTAGPVEAYRRQPQAHGGERYVAILFCDLRGFTSISEGRLPYDVVFLLNRYFRATGQAVQAAGGSSG